MNKTAKRCFDVFSASFLFVALIWVFPIIWVSIRLNSKGEALYAQKRVGQNQKYFRCYKFRTMRLGTPEVGTHEASRDSITGVGNILRKTKLDELPQLINVIVGDMSLVGPRPCLPSQSMVIEARIRKNVFSAKPGITGLAQIRGVDMSVPEKLASVDLEYLQTQTLLGDVKILLATALGKGAGDRTCPIVQNGIASSIVAKNIENKSCQKNE